jgi:hypothetical protein
MLSAAKIVDDLLHVIHIGYLVPYLKEINEVNAESGATFFC